MREDRQATLWEAEADWWQTGKLLLERALLPAWPSCDPCLNLSLLTSPNFLKFFFLIFTLFLSMCICLSLCVDLGTECRCPQKPESSLDPPELELQMVVSNPMWMLGNQIGSPGRPVRALGCLVSLQPFT